MIEYKTGTDVIDWTSLVELYFATDLVIGLGKAKNLSKIKESFLKSYKIVTAWEGEIRRRTRYGHTRPMFEQEISYLPVSAPDQGVQLRSRPEWLWHPPA